MAKVDETDLAILSELDRNARQTNAEIGRKLDISGSRIGHRIRYLEEHGIIQEYQPRIDFYKLGYQNFRLYLKLQHTNRGIEDEMVEYLVSSPLTGWCSRASGRFDLGALLWFRDSEDIFTFWNKFMGRFKPYIKKAAITPRYGEDEFRLPFGISSKEHLFATGKAGVSVIDDKDKLILRILTKDGRSSLRKIGSMAGLSAVGVKYRIDDLMKKGVLKAVRSVVNMGKLGYASYKVDFNLSDYKNKEKMERFLLEKSNLSHLVRTMGASDIEARIFSRSAKRLEGSLGEFRDKFFKDLVDYTYFAYTSIPEKHEFRDF